MPALTDSEIFSKLPVESRTKINNAFEALTQSLLNPSEQAVLYRIVHSLKLSPNEAQFSFLAAMHYYLQLYQVIPDKISSAGNDIRQAAVDVEAAIKKATAEALNSHIGALKVQANLVAIQTQNRLINKVVEIAQKIAGDSAAKERHTAFVKATVAVAIGFLICVCVATGSGYLFGMANSFQQRNAAEKNLTSALNQVEVIKRDSNSAIVAANKKAAAEIADARAASGWASTPDGQLARRFFELQQSGRSAATCHGDGWKVFTAIDEKTNNERRFCLVKMAPFSLFGSNDTKMWEIP